MRPGDLAPCPARLHGFQVLRDAGADWLRVVGGEVPHRADRDGGGHAAGDGAEGGDDGGAAGSGLVAGVLTSAMGALVAVFVRTQWAVVGSVVRAMVPA